MKRIWIALFTIIPACGGSGGSGGSGGTGSGGCPGSYPVAYKDTCMPAGPMVEVNRTTCNNQDGIREYCAADNNPTPQLGCLPNHADSTAPATPATATLTGFVKVFSAGPSSNNIKVEVFRQADLATADALMTASPIGTFTTNVQADITAGTARACPQAEQGTNPPPCVVPMPSACNPGCGDPTQNYCDGTMSPGTCQQVKRYEARYTIPNVPTNTPIAVRTSGPGGTTDTTWAPLIQFRGIIPTNDRMCSGPGDDVCWKDANKTTYEGSASVLSRSDYYSIPTTVGLSNGISPGRGAIAGEVRDCDNVRIEHATVGYSPLPDRFAYFNSNPYMTLPVSGKLDTDALGLFTGMNLPAGAIRVRAQGKMGGQLIDLGGADAVIFPDSVTVVGINAGRPIDQPM